jgi:hypothetical protein
VYVSARARVTELLNRNPKGESFPSVIDDMFMTRLPVTGKN